MREDVIQERALSRLEVLWITRGYEVRRLRERFVLWLVWRLPRWLVYWCAIRLIAHATTGEHSDQVVPDLSAMDALSRWDMS